MKTIFEELNTGYKIDCDGTLHHYKKNNRSYDKDYCSCEFTRNGNPKGWVSTKPSLSKFWEIAE